MQIHSNHMGIEKMRLLVCKCINMDTNIEKTIKHCSTWLENQNMQLQEKAIPHELLAKPWDVVGTGIFMVTYETLLCNVYYYSKFLVVKKVGSMLAGDLIWATKFVFAKFGLPKKLCQMQAHFLF